MRKALINLLFTVEGWSLKNLINLIMLSKMFLFAQSVTAQSKARENQIFGTWKFNMIICHF